MIVSHKHRYIFVKTTKTAGTSVEIALSRHCGPRDIITPVSPDDEITRRLTGGRAPQHFMVPLWRQNTAQWVRFLRRGKRYSFRNHTPASEVRRLVGESTWKAYYKFTIERDPFDKAISRYYWSTTPPRPPLEQFLADAPAHQLSNWDIYAIDGTIAMDFVIRYERLQEDLQAVAARIGIEGILELPRAKGGHRTERAHYSRILDTAGRARIEAVCAREIAALGYQWRDATYLTETAS